MNKIIILVTLLISTTYVHAQLFVKRQPATQDAIMQLNVQTRGNLEEILWFISDPIEIERQIEITADLNVNDLQEKGKLKIQGGKYYELAKFVNTASGLLEYKNDSIIAVRFEQGEGRFLEFHLSKMEKMETVRYYRLKIKDKSPNKLTGGKVHYAGYDWTIVSGARVILEFKAKGNNDTKVDKTKIRGLNKDGTERKGIIPSFKKDN